MSTIRFHSPEGTAEVAGREWYHGVRFESDLLWSVLGVGDEGLVGSPLRLLLPDGCYLHRLNGTRFAEALRTWMRVGAPSFVLDGQPLPVAEVAANTALALGSDPVRLLVRLCEQSEINAFVRGPNRAWLAGIVDQGRAIGFLHANCGWEEVASLLRESTETAVVTSTSHGDSFPNASLPSRYGLWCPPEDDPNGDTWFDLTHEERWRLALLALEEENRRSNLELRPENWERFRFGRRLTSYDLNERAKHIARERADTAAPEGYVSLAEAAHLLGVRSRPAVLRWVTGGLLQGFRFGIHVVVARDSVEAMRQHPEIARERQLEADEAGALEPFAFDDEPGPDGG